MPDRVFASEIPVDQLPDPHCKHQQYIDKGRFVFFEHVHTYIQLYIGRIHSRNPLSLLGKGMNLLE